MNNFLNFHSIILYNYFLLLIIITKENLGLRKPTIKCSLYILFYKKIILDVEHMYFLY